MFTHGFVAGSTQAAHEAVDHLNGTEDGLQDARGHQSSKQSNVELHYVLRLRARNPRVAVTQVVLVTV